VKEQSHKSEMGAALRGDFERLRARRRGDSSLIEPPTPVGPPPSQPVAVEPEPEPTPAPAPAPAAEGGSGGSWLDRLRGRT
jgi:hypothetical protein